MQSKLSWNTTDEIDFLSKNENILSKHNSIYFANGTFSVSFLFVSGIELGYVFAYYNYVGQYPEETRQD
jgi:hypothetical protein